jgi:hypothetical protein
MDAHSASGTGLAEYVFTTMLPVNQNPSAHFVMEYAPFGLADTVWGNNDGNGSPPNNGVAPIWEIRNGLNDLPQGADTDCAGFGSAGSPTANANGAIRVGIVPPGGVAAQGIGLYEGNNPWPIDGVSMSGSADDLKNALNALNVSAGNYGGYTVKLGAQPDVPAFITLGPSTGSGTVGVDEFPAIQSSGLVIDGAGAVIKLPSVEGLWAVNSNTVSYGPNVGRISVAGFARVATTALSSSTFNAVARDEAGNTYAVGYQNGVVAFKYDDANTNAWATGGFTGGNAVIVKYNSDGVAQWARTVTGGGNTSIFNGVAVSPDGSSVYAVGAQYITGTFNYGNSASVQGTATTGYNAVIVKYDSAGVAQWAKATTATSTSSINYNAQFFSVAADWSGAYAVGYQAGHNLPFTYGSVTLTGNTVTVNPQVASVIVRYDGSDGAVSWANTVRSTVAGNEGAGFMGVALDGSGNVYAAGYLQGLWTYEFGMGANNDGTVKQVVNRTYGTTYRSVVIVKYAGSTGQPLLAQGIESVSHNSVSTRFAGIAVDGQGNVYVAGNHEGVAAGQWANYGNGVTTTVPNISRIYATVVKYDSNLKAQWARVALATSTSTTVHSLFRGIAVDGAGNVYAAGTQTGTAPFIYGPGVSTAATGGFSTNYNSVVVQYDSATGTALWARAVTDGGGASYFYGIAADSAGNVSTAGTQTNTGTFNYGGRATAQGGAAGTNAVVVGWR